MPKAPPMPQIILPEPADVPNYEDEARKKEEAEKQRRRASNRKGRKSTLLTGSGGLDEIDEENYEQKSLLGE